jgi:Protein of unknown function (DUF2612)
MSADPAILKYYSDLLIVQYRMKTRAIQTTQLVCNCALCDGLAQAEMTCFDLNTAIGNQLTILGKIVGVPRNIYGLDLTHTFWEFTTYARNPTGNTMDLYAGPHPASTYAWRLYQTTATYTLSDFEMRALIKLKIAINNIRSTTKAITESLFAVSGTGIRFSDTKNMKVGFDVYPPYNNMMVVANYLNMLPKPMGVSSTIGYH